ncbi:MAG: hypothetical protein JNK04_18045 [Myxococcales bacterium]|nr:hypothetical protein [Myxococcales bacterium]
MKSVGVFMFSAACGLLFGAAGCSTRCTLVGCVSNVSTVVSVEGDAESVVGSVVTMCQNDACVSGTLEYADKGAEMICSFEGEQPYWGTSCLAWVEGDQVTIWITLEVTDWYPLEQDTFRFVVASADDPDEVLAEREGKPDYEVLQPNGEECGPTCYVATIGA